MAILLSKAVSGQCRWIVCEAVAPRKGEPRDIFGGRRVCGAAVSWPTSYCLGHRLVVYAPVEKTPAPPQEFALLRRPPEPETLPELTEIFG